MRVQTRMPRSFRQMCVAAGMALTLVVGLSGASAGQLPLAPGLGQNPSTGGLRAGALGLNPPPSRGVLPLAIQIPDAAVDSEVEQVEIIAGVMQDPSGPFVVSWYRESGRLGSRGNAVMAGHVDYWDVGPAVFYTVGQLQPGASIAITGEEGISYRYEVEWVQTYSLTELTSDLIQDLVGPTKNEVLTLITCGGDFDYATGEYLSRTIVRAKRVSATEIAGVGAPAPVDSAPGGISDTTGGAPSTDTTDAAPSTDTGFGAGSSVTVNDSGVNLRAAASTDGEIVTTLDAGAALTITGGAIEADGFLWWPVEAADGSTGFIAADFIE